MPMFETLKQKFTGEETMRRKDPPREDKRAAAAEEMNSDDLVTGGAVPGESDEDLRTVWGSRTGPDTLPSEADATVTSVSASSAQLLSHGGRFGSAYCKIMYVPRDGWPANPESGLLDRLTAHSSAGVQVKLRVEPMDRKRAAAEFKRRVKQEKQRTVFEAAGRSARRRNGRRRKARTRRDAPSDRERARVDLLGRCDFRRSGE